MKIRTSLVSNSSSASFIVLWRCFDLEGNDVNDAVDVITNPRYAFETSKEQVYKKSIIDATESLGDKMFRSTFSVSMYNDYDDIPEACKFLIYLLSFKNKAKLINYEEDDES